MNLPTFLTLLRTSPLTVEFTDTIAAIDSAYVFTPTAFGNGDAYNAVGQNNGACKILAFGRLQQLNEAETLACFGHYYRDDVLQHPDGDDHANIRNFMRHGWSGVRFEGEALMDAASPLA